MNFTVNYTDSAPDKCRLGIKCSKHEERYLVSCSTCKEERQIEQKREIEEDRKRIKEEKEQIEQQKREIEEDRKKIEEEKRKIQIEQEKNKIEITGIDGYLRPDYPEVVKEKLNILENAISKLLACANKSNFYKSEIEKKRKSQSINQTEKGQLEALEDIYTLNSKIANTISQSSNTVKHGFDLLSVNIINENLANVIRIIDAQTQLTFVAISRLVWQGKIDSKLKYAKKICQQMKDLFLRLKEELQKTVCFTLLGVAVGGVVVYKFWEILGPWAILVGAVVGITTFCFLEYITWEDKGTIWDPEVKRKIEKFKKDFEQRENFENLANTIEKIVTSTRIMSSPCFIKNDECAVCTEIIDGIKYHPFRLNNDGCRHVFCECLPNIGNCPLCRAPYVKKIKVCVVCYDPLNNDSYSCGVCKIITCMKCVDKMINV